MDRQTRIVLQTLILAATVCIIAIVAGAVLVLIFQPDAPWWQVLITALVPALFGPYGIYRWISRRHRR